MPTPILTLEPRDAGSLDPEDLTVEFEDDRAAGMYGMQRCGATFMRGASTSRDCYFTIPD